MKNLVRRIKATWKPEMFQGWGKQNGYFEGWYFKIVSSDTNTAWAIIPGVAHGDDDHAFIQVMDGIRATSQYHRFPADSFIPHPRKFSLSIGDNQFSADGITLSLPELQGTLRFSDMATWQGSWTRPGIMGWYSFVPFMQCYHGLVSLDHEIAGKLTHYDRVLDFTGGRGYIEKDWGSSFPKAWIWTQCNHYDQEGPISVMASVAHIPWLSSAFVGFLALIWYRNRIKIFTTYTGAKMKAKIVDQSVVLEFADEHESLQITAHQTQGADLVSPIQGAMVGKVNESIRAKHQISYITRDGRTLNAEGIGAGLEVAGDTSILLTD